MIIAIHHKENGFSQKWIEYCETNNIKYKLVNCYDNDIVAQIEECDALMWHWHHNNPKDILFARQLIYSIEMMGKKVFPNSKTVWHFDDKVGQKYLLESIKAPTINSYVFYDKQEAIKWIGKTTLPKIFKLRGGAGSENVKMIDTYEKAITYINQAFGTGFTGYNRFHSFKEKVWSFQRDKTFKSFINIAKGIGRVFIPHSTNKLLPIEKGYLYAQDFIPNNDSDIRVIIIGNRAFAIKRMTRDGDFRASGSGNIIYESTAIPQECIKIAFETTTKLQIQSAAYDFVFLNDKPLIIEISYGFAQSGYLDCPGYWNDNLEFIEGRFTPEFFMIEDLINKQC